MAENQTKRPHTRQAQPPDLGNKWTAQESNPTTGMHGQLQPPPLAASPESQTIRRKGHTARRRNAANQTPERKPTGLLNPKTIPTCDSILTNNVAATLQAKNIPESLVFQQKFNVRVFPNTSGETIHAENQRHSGSGSGAGVPSPAPGVCCICNVGTCVRLWFGVSCGIARVRSYLCAITHVVPSRRALATVATIAAIVPR